MKTINILIILLAIMAFPALGQGDAAREIMQKSIDVSRVKGIETITELRIMDAKGHERDRKIAMASRREGDMDKRIIKFLEPADVKGTGLLIFDYSGKDDEMWLYMPAIRKTRKIVSSEKGKNFMGSEFSNADMAAPNLDDFTLESKGEAEADGTTCYKILMVPKSDKIAREYGFSKKMVWIGKKDYVMRRAEYFDQDGTLQKVLTATDVQPVDPQHTKYLAREMTIVNKENGRSSSFKMTRVQYNPDIDPNIFTLSYLER